MQKSYTFQLFLFLNFMYYLCIWVISVKLLPYFFISFMFMYNVIDVQYDAQLHYSQNKGNNSSKLRPCLSLVAPTYNITECIQFLYSL